MKKYFKISGTILFICGLLFSPYYIVDILNTIKKDNHVHSYREWIVISPAKYWSFGSKKRVCEVCGQTQYGRIWFSVVIHYALLLLGLIIVIFLLRLIKNKYKLFLLSNSYFMNDELYYSTIYGNGIYVITEETLFDPFNSDDHHSKSKVIKNLNTNEMYFAKKIEDRYIEKYREAILHPLPRNIFFWPFDIVLADRRQKKISELSVATKYSDSQLTSEESSRSYVLFPYDGYKHMVNAKIWLERFGKEANWKNKKIMEFIFHFLQIISKINHMGYLYFDFHLSQILIDSSDEIKLNFSHLFFLRDSDETNRKNISNDNYPIETAEPATFQGKNNTLDLQCQNYSLSSFLFYLMFNHWPYDGRLLDEYTDTTTQQHYTKFRQYQKMPVFIFDPEDDQNHLGVFNDEDSILNIWNDCPDMIKSQFIRILQRENAERKGEEYSLSADEWLTIFQESGLSGITT